MEELTGQVIVITGASVGLGKCLALRLAYENPKLILLARSGHKLYDVVEEITKRGVSCSSLCCDVSNAAQLDNICEYIEDAHGSLDILVNNAGVWFEGPTESHTPEKIQELFSVNSTGPILATRAFLPLLKKSKHAQIFNVVSDSGIDPSGNWGVYAATKFALRGFTESLRMELSGSGVKVMGLYPGGMNTKLFDDAGFPKGEAPWMMKKEDVAEIVAFMLRQAPDVVMNHVEVHKLM